MMSHVKPIKFEDVYVGICLNLLKVDIHIPEDTNLFFLYRIHLNVCQIRCMIAAHGFSSKEIITFWQAMLRNTTCHFFPLYQCLFIFLLIFLASLLEYNCFTMVC